MLAHDFIYYQPHSIAEALAAYQEATESQLFALYYGGGSEIITMCRAGSRVPQAVIDLKKIPECNVLEKRAGSLHLGSAVSLRALRDSDIFPLLGSCAGRIADHTNQCRITLGGNLNSTIIYRETVLALLLADTTLLLASPQGQRLVLLSEVFKERLRLDPGEFVVAARVDAAFASLPYWHQKKTTAEKIDYPLVTSVALRCAGRLRLALSGVCSFPFRSTALEAALNDLSLERDARVEAALQLLPEAPRNDSFGSSAFRLHLLRHTLRQLLEENER